MKTFLSIALIVFALSACGQSRGKEKTVRKNGAEYESVKKEDANMNEYKPLTEFEEYVIVQKGTERPFTGKYNNHKEKGTYVCKR